MTLYVLYACMYVCMHIYPFITLPTLQQILYHAIHFRRYEKIKIKIMIIFKKHNYYNPFLHLYISLQILFLSIKRVSEYIVILMECVKFHFNNIATLNSYSEIKQKYI